ncbi:hypothetical protein L7F22_038457 [Adiantum nelumboides]|nr:hypothetical protein [Adiantum nelumboides]
MVSLGWDWFTSSPIRDCLSVCTCNGDDADSGLVVAATVRIATLHGINAIMRSKVPPNVVLTLLVPAVQDLVFDQTEKVRKFFFHSVAEWLGYEFEGSHFIEDKSRLLNCNDWVPKLLPLLLYGIFDNSAEVGTTALLLVEGIGKLYAAYSTSIENIMTICDSQDERAYKSNGRSHCARDVEMEYQLLLPAPFKGRPGEGCCMLVQAFLKELIGPIKDNLQEWSEITRCGAARLLLALLVMAEQRAGAYLHLIVPALSSAVGDDNLCIAKLLVESAHILGWHTSPHAWLPLVLGQVASSAANSAQVTNKLVVLSGLLYGTQKQAADKDLAKEVIQHLINVNSRFPQHESIHHQQSQIPAGNAKNNS